MGLEMIISDFLIEILTGLIIAAIIGAATSFYILIKCVHKQKDDIALMKKATIIVLRFIVKDRQHFHGGEMLTDFEKLYKELIKDD